MVDSTSTCQDHAGALVMGFDVVNEVIAADAFDILGGTQNSSAERSSLVCNGVQVIENNLLEVHFNLLHFTENDTTFTFDFLIVKGIHIIRILALLPIFTNDTYLFTKL